MLRPWAINNCEGKQRGKWEALEWKMFFRSFPGKNFVEFIFSEDLKFWIVVSWLVSNSETFHRLRFLVELNQSNENISKFCFTGCIIFRGSFPNGSSLSFFYSSLFSLFQISWNSTFPGIFIFFLSLQSSFSFFPTIFFQNYRKTNSNNERNLKSLMVDEIKESVN